ncbi:hypothetical protein GCM10027062_33950 [Nocardioides hungaricus]
MTIDLSWATAESIAGALDSARAGLDECAGSAPAGVDGGEATATINAMIARVSESAAGLSEGLSAASQNVRTASGSLFNADLSAQQGLTLPGAP